MSSNLNGFLAVFPFSQSTLIRHQIIYRAISKQRGLLHGFEGFPVDEHLGTYCQSRSCRYMLKSLPSIAHYLDFVGNNQRI